MKKQTIRIAKNLISDLKDQLNSIKSDIKPSYLWELSLGDVHHVLDTCKKLAIDLSGLQAIAINGMIYITKNQSLVKHLKSLVEDSFNAFIDVSPDLPSPQLLSQKQISDKKLILKLLLKEIGSISDQQYLKVDLDEEIADMCLITGSLLGYPVIYSNREPQSGNCLAFEPLSHYVLLMSHKTIYSFSCPQKYCHLFDSQINSWFQSLKCMTKDESISLNESIKTMSFVLT